jgi:hypothetical protein
LDLFGLIDLPDFTAFDHLCDCLIDNFHPKRACSGAGPKSDVHPLHWTVFEKVFDVTADCIEVAPYFHPLVCADQDLIARPSRPSPAPLEVAQPDIACSTPARQGRCVANRFLRRKLANAAEKNGRSLNSEILHRLDQTFGEEFLQFVAELEKRERLFLEALERAKQDPEKMKRLRET